jgi:hypothetical protein
VLVDCAHVGAIAEEGADARGDAIPFVRGAAILFGRSPHELPQHSMPQ